MEQHEQHNGNKTGRISKVSGPVIVASGLNANMFDIVRVGNESLLGEVIQVREDSVVVQVYEDTTGLKPGDIVEGTGKPLSVMLGPGLLGSIYDGIQRPLPQLESETGFFLKRGVTADGLDGKKEWDFEPSAKEGDKIIPGTILGTVKEGLFEHRILVPAGAKGILKSISAGKFTISQQIGEYEEDHGHSTHSSTQGMHSNGLHHLYLAQSWPVRMPRPSVKKLPPKIPLITGQRVIDAFFPIAKGGAACIPGPFGAGKTVNQQQLAKWCDADIIVYVGCGERGNEMTEILTEFPRLSDPKSGRPLMERTVLIANTSNMPVAAREASIYTGATIAEYFRDMGYHVALMADSTSRWAEAMREISSRLEEMPGEEGYPAYLASRLSQFYERAGRVIALGSKHPKPRKGSVTLIGAVSPPGGDFSEPVTQSTLRVTKAFWALDAKLSQRRHFPAINWLQSYSLYNDSLEVWFVENVAQDWRELATRLASILAEEDKLLEIVQLVGSDALPDKEQLTLDIARMIREGFLQQNAFHEQDSVSSLKKTYMMMKCMAEFNSLALAALQNGAGISQIRAVKARDKLLLAKYEKDAEAYLKALLSEMEREFSAMFSINKPTSTRGKQ